MKEISSFYDQSALNPHEKYADWTESPFHTGLSDMTGVDIQFIVPTTGTDGTTFTNTLMADPTNLPDIMGVQWMNDAELYLQDEVIWDLTPLPRGVRSRLLRLPEGQPRLRQGDED